MVLLFAALIWQKNFWVKSYALGNRDIFNCCSSFIFFWFIPVFFHGIPWQPTDMKRVRRMLEMADIKPDEVVYDLGCGDGRIIICRKI